MVKKTKRALKTSQSCIIRCTLNHVTGPQEELALSFEANLTSRDANQWIDSLSQIHQVQKHFKSLEKLLD